MVGAGLRIGEVSTLLLDDIEEFSSEAWLQARCQESVSQKTIENNVLRGRSPTPRTI